MKSNGMCAIILFHSDEKLMKLEQYRLVPAYLLFAMVLIVTIRFRCTNTFHSIRSAMEYSSVAQQDEFPENKEQVRWVALMIS